MTDTITIHLCDWNLNDRLIEVPRAAIQILFDTTKPAEDRLSKLYDIALQQGKVDGNPRVRDLGLADLFLSWPGGAPGFINDSEWDNEFAQQLEEYRTPTCN